jgi:hypothetical protein
MVWNSAGIFVILFKMFMLCIRVHLHVYFYSMSVAMTVSMVSASIPF